MDQINYFSKEPYTGENAQALEILSDEFGCSEWLTFVQCQYVGRSIIKGSKGVRLSRVLEVDIKGKTERRIKRFTVFNLTQTQKCTKKSKSTSLEWVEHPQQNTPKSKEKSGRVALRA